MYGRRRFYRGGFRRHYGYRYSRRRRYGGYRHGYGHRYHRRGRYHFAGTRL